MESATIASSAFPAPDEDDLHNGKHPDDERDGGADLHGDAASEATIIASTIVTWGGEYNMPINPETHNAPCSHAL